MSDYITLPRTWCTPLMKNVTPSVRAHGCPSTKQITLYLEVDTHSILAPFQQRLSVTEDQALRLIHQLECAIGDMRGV